MPVHNIDPARVVSNFKLHGTMMRYNLFAARLFNLCLSLGFEPGRIMPSRAFCSDENQGFPIIMLARHFGAFPFNHGRVGGIVSTDRHAPHAEHGHDLVLVQASHVGYDPETQQFGNYRRLQTEGQCTTPTCGKIHLVTDWYMREYQRAANNIQVHMEGDRCCLQIDNEWLQEQRDEGLFLHFEQLLADVSAPPLRRLSTAKIYTCSAALAEKIKAARVTHGQPLGHLLSAELFHFSRAMPDEVEGKGHLERNLMESMPAIMTSESPLLVAAMVNTEIEFDRTYRSLLSEPCYQGRRLLFVSGLNIDISPNTDQFFPLTKFVPWAAYVQEGADKRSIWEQPELVARLIEQNSTNPHKVDLEAAIASMAAKEELGVKLPSDLDE
jgi:hypothetical protein